MIVKNVEEMNVITEFTNQVNFLKTDFPECEKSESLKTFNVFKADVLILECENSKPREKPSRCVVINNAKIQVYQKTVSIYRPITTDGETLYSFYAKFSLNENYVKFFVFSQEIVNQKIIEVMKN